MFLCSPLRLSELDEFAEAHTSGDTLVVPVAAAVSLLVLHSQLLFYCLVDKKFHEVASPKRQTQAAGADMVPPHRRFVSQGYNWGAVGSPLGYAGQ